MSKTGAYVFDLQQMPAYEEGQHCRATSYTEAAAACPYEAGREREAYMLGYQDAEYDAMEREPDDMDAEREIDRRDLNTDFDL